METRNIQIWKQEVFGEDEDRTPAWIVYLTGFPTIRKAKWEMSQIEEPGIYCVIEVWVTAEIATVETTVVKPL